MDILGDFFDFLWFFLEPICKWGWKLISFLFHILCLIMLARTLERRLVGDKEMEERDKKRLPKWLLDTSKIDKRIQKIDEENRIVRERIKVRKRLNSILDARYRRIQEERRQMKAARRNGNPPISPAWAYFFMMLGLVILFSGAMLLFFYMFVNQK